MRLLEFFESINEAIRIQEPQTGLLYRWVEPRKALSNLKTNSLNPGKWKHDIPGVGYVSGISFGYDSKTWRSDTADVCFVVNRGEMNPKKFVDIPGQEIFNYTNARHNPVGDRFYANEYLKGALDPVVIPNEAFYIGIVRPLDKVLDHIIIQRSVKNKPKLYDAIRVYSMTHNIPVKWLEGGELDKHELGLTGRELQGGNTLGEDIYRSNSPCVPLALLRVTGIDPAQVQDACVSTNWSDRHGMNVGQIIGAIRKLGFDYKTRNDLVHHKAKNSRTGTITYKTFTMNQSLKRIPDRGRFLILLKDHTVAVVDGKLMDDARYGLRHKVFTVLEVFPNSDTDDQLVQETIKTVSGSNGMDIKVLKNPSARQLRNFLMTTRHQKLRGLWDGESFYFWDAAFVIHKDMASKLGIPYDINGRLDIYIRSNDDIVIDHSSEYHNRYINTNWIQRNVIVEPDGWQNFILKESSTPPKLSEDWIVYTNVPDMNIWT